MIWIATLCLLCLAAWLGLSAMNERRWVHEHLHDETVAADPGFIPDMSRVTSKLSLEDDNTPLSRAVSSVQSKTSGVGERLGKVAQAAKVDESQSARFTGRTGADLMGAAAAKVGVDTDGLGKKIKERASSTLEAQKGSDGVLGKVAGGVSTLADKAASKINERK